MERRRLVLRSGEVVTCELLAVVRDHHDSMPTPGRDRPGTDRARVRTPSGEEIVVDLWSSSGQDLTTASGSVELFERSELLCWRPAVVLPSTAGGAAGGRNNPVAHVPVFDEARGDAPAPANEAGGEHSGDADETGPRAQKR